MNNLTIMNYLWGKISRIKVITNKLIKTNTTNLKTTLTIIMIITTTIHTITTIITIILTTTRMITTTLTTITTSTRSNNKTMTRTLTAVPQNQRKIRIAISSTNNLINKMISSITNSHKDKQISIQILVIRIVQDLLCRIRIIQPMMIFLIIMMILMQAQRQRHSRRNVRTRRSSK